MAELFNDNRLRWSRLYSEVELYKAAVRLYTKPLFAWRKALSASRDGKTLYDFARRGLQHIDAIHRALPEMRDAVNRWETHVASILANAADNPAEARAA